ncbi:hypothetical protein JYU34_009562 [Plutella xylostella]|uniref:Chitin-binding type-2 domain-containing protein n=1 Tax=Plutella xylostella TaxID=51655 RepID=A0ABQ7QKR5_PLUXY|nr:hypothetical protein JYU34_009562 [Plutella xylostella]
MNMNIFLIRPLTRNRNLNKSANITVTIKKSVISKPNLTNHSRGAMLRLWTFVVLASLCHSVSVAGQCTSYGRFPNDAVPDCRGYVMCIDRGGGSFTQYNLTCPTSFIFSPVEHVCTNVTTYACLNRPIQYHCNATGMFPNPLTKDCLSYIACLESLNSTIVPRLYSCPPATLFNAATGVCVSETEFQCVVEEETAPDALDILLETTNKQDGASVNSKNNKAIYVGAECLMIVGLLGFVTLFR